MLVCPRSHRFAGSGTFRPVNLRSVVECKSWVHFVVILVGSDNAIVTITEQFGILYAARTEIDSQPVVYRL